ncbi:hypothetical protein BLNAU_11072 [Blattamonas nauphoetae]|uniref:B30.2/SPRY domain-containing protein n=1 Tax=Blattamonas nauphoetae TaxID=2049346 RepID=A0ABQ9XRK0_9EUKA|nr:hypothetical protein BLNAU_11072 [Blattamonas nauphoetae]
MFTDLSAPNGLLHAPTQVDMNAVTLLIQNALEQLKSGNTEKQLAGTKALRTHLEESGTGIGVISQLCLECGCLEPLVQIVTTTANPHLFALVDGLLHEVVAAAVLPVFVRPTDLIAPLVTLSTHTNPTIAESATHSVGLLCCSVRSPSEMESVLSGGIVERVCREIESCSDTAALTSLVGVLGNVCRGIAGFRRSEEAKKKAKQPKEGKDEAEHTNEDNDSFSIFVRSGHALEMMKQTLLQLVSRMRTGKDDVEEEEGRRRTRLNEKIGGVLIEFFAETVGGGRAERVGGIGIDLGKELAEMRRREEEREKRREEERRLEKEARLREQREMDNKMKEIKRREIEREEAYRRKMQEVEEERKRNERFVEEMRRREREEEEEMKPMERVQIRPTAVWEPKRSSRVEGTKIIATDSSETTIPLSPVLTEGVWLVEVKAGPVLGWAFGFFQTPWDQDWSKTLGSDQNSADYNRKGGIYHSLKGDKYGEKWAAGDVLGVEVDMQQRRAFFFRNGKRQPTIFTSIPPKVQVGVSLHAKDASMELVTFKQLARTSFQAGADDMTVAW